MNHSSQVAIVTGGRRGIGAAIVKRLNLRGIKVAAVDKDFEQEILEGNFLQLPYDVCHRDKVARSISRAEELLGPITILVNNAGIGGPFHRIDQVSDEEWDSIITTNVKGTFFFCRNLLPKMKAQKYGRLVQIASIQGLFGAPSSSTYVASKHALIGYTRAIAAEWGEFGITCNAICPGYVDTRMGVQTDLVPDHLRRVQERTPVKRIASPEEVAALVEFVVGPEAGYLNGSILTLDGGITSHLGI